MKKVLRNIKTCRACKQLFNQIQGIKHLDQVCCSESCFLRVGPIKLEEVTVQHDSSRAQRKRIRDKSRKTHKIEDNHFYRSSEWLELRYQMLKRYGRECMLCGETKGKMQVDHIKPRLKYPSLSLDMENLQILCKTCSLGKSDKFEDDFRPVKIA